MDRRSWLWRRKSSETESSGSVSSHSERYSEDQEGLRVSSVNASPNNARSPEVSSKLNGFDSNETIKSLNEKLSAALLSINCKEELIQQHVKVAEEAVAGWEKAEAEVAALKKQLEVVLQKNSALEDRTKQLDAALKECVRQLRQSREEQEQHFHETLIKKNKEWEDEKLELQTQIIELRAKLEVKAETASSIDHQVFPKLEVLEKEKSYLQIELLAKTEDLHLRTLERDLSTQAAETASKQHLESIKKLAKLEAECRRLRKFSPLNDYKICVESLTDSQSDSGERLITLDNEPSCSDSWASALMAELDQFKNEKATKSNLTGSTTEIDLMDDFLEMERLAALPEVGNESSSLDIDVNSEPSVEVKLGQSDELKQKIARFEAEKVEMEMALSESRNQLKLSCDKLIIADNRLIELQQEKHIFDAQMEEVDAKRKEVESQLESAQLEIIKLNERAGLLEGNFEKAVSENLESRFKEMVSVEEERKALELQLKMAQSKVGKLHMTVGFLEKEIEEERKLSSEYLTRCQEMEIINTNSREMETQLISANREVDELHIKVHSLEGKLKEEEALSAKLAANMEDVEENRKTMSTQIESANVESVKLKERIRHLEEEVEQEGALSAELTEKCQHLQSELSSADFEVRKLHEKVRSLERIIDEERTSLTEFKAQAEASMEEKEIAWESQIRSTGFEVEELHKKVNLLERKAEEERAIYAGLVASKEELETQLESAHKEKSISMEAPVKKQDDKLLLRKEEDFVMASEMFVACQKTINSISQQLKYLSNFDNLMLESCGPSSSSS